MLCWVLHTRGTHRQRSQQSGLNHLFLAGFFAFLEKNSCSKGCEEEQDAGGRVTQTIQ